MQTERDGTMLMYYISNPYLSSRDTTVVGVRDQGAAAKAEYGLKLVSSHTKEV